MPYAGAGLATAAQDMQCWQCSGPSTGHTVGTGVPTLGTGSELPPSSPGAPWARSSPGHMVEFDSPALAPVRFCQVKVSFTKLSTLQIRVQQRRV